MSTSPEYLYKLIDEEGLRHWCRVRHTGGLNHDGFKIKPHLLTLGQLLERLDEVVTDLQGSERRSGDGGRGLVTQGSERRSGAGDGDAGTNAHSRTFGGG